jgi:hypothetical protein
MGRNRSTKKPGGVELDFDLNIDFDGPDTGDDGVLDQIFDRYYTPEPPDDADAPEGETFVEAAEAEASQMMDDLQKADQHASLLHNTKKAVDSGTDTDYYLVVTFVSEEQKLEFLRKSGWEKYGGARYLNGVKLAQDMGIELEPAYLAVSSKPDKHLSERSQTHGSSKKTSARQRRQ